jgi:hypothetical protein
MLGKRPAAEVLEACGPECANARLKLDTVTRRRAESDDVLSDELLVALDMKAHDLLTQGGVRQHERPSTKRLVLARAQPDGSMAVLKEGEGAQLNETHLGLFPPPLKTRKRKS